MSVLSLVGDSVVSINPLRDSDVCIILVTGSIPIIPVKDSNVCIIPVRDSDVL